MGLNAAGAAAPAIAHEIVARSWTHLIEELYAESWQESMHRYRSNYAFRGLSTKDFALKTSLFRLGGNHKELEFHLLRNFVKYARLRDAASYSVWESLTIAQHHGLPTRLLDWTYSPFVAMHFATSNIEEYDTDGVIWCADFMGLHAMLPDILKAELDRERSNVFTVEMLSKVSPSLHNFDEISKDNFMVFFEPPSMDDRIVNQFALHSVISNGAMIPSEFLQGYPSTYKRIIIPASVKWEIRDKLDQANINERVMFPGLDGLCRWLRRHYSPR